jgi:hypothetical protein
MKNAECRSGGRASVCCYSWHFVPPKRKRKRSQREKERPFYFEDLPGELQRVLRVQLRRPGDVSAVIETPGGFLLYVAKEKTDNALTTACLSIPKRSYEQWLSGTTDY